MINPIQKLIISLTIIPLIIIVNSLPSLGSISETKTAAGNRDIGTEDLRKFPSNQAEGDYLSFGNLSHQLNLLNDAEMNNISPIKAEANSTNKLWQLNQLLTAARNEKTRECRVSGLCS